MSPVLFSAILASDKTATIFQRHTRALRVGGSSEQACRLDLQTLGADHGRDLVETEISEVKGHHNRDCSLLVPGDDAVPSR